MAPGEGGLGFPSDDVVCGWHVLGDILEQRVGQELVTGGQVGPPFWWEWGSEALNSRFGRRGLVHWISDSVLGQQWPLQINPCLSFLKEVGKVRPVSKQG